jgi:hypothetical protein
MPNRAILLLLLGLSAQHKANAQLSLGDTSQATMMLRGATCLEDSLFSPVREVFCTQLAVAAKLRSQPQASPAMSKARLGGVGKGAMVGLGAGLVPGILAALIVAPGCEENQSKCVVGFIVGGAALGAGIGAVVGAVLGD